MKATAVVLVTVASILGLSSQFAARTNVTGIVVDEEGQPIAGVACRATGWPLPGGGRVSYSGMPTDHLTDVDGRFTIPLPRSDPLVDLQFDHGTHAPVFLYEVQPAASPLKVVMPKGKMLKGRIVDEQLSPLPNAELELQMAQSGIWYQRKGFTDRSGEFHFRLGEPPQEHSWRLSYAGKQFRIDYDLITPETVVELKVSIKMTLKAEPAKREPIERRRGKSSSVGD